MIFNNKKVKYIVFSIIIFFLIFILFYVSWYTFNKRKKNSHGKGVPLREEVYSYWEVRMISISQILVELMIEQNLNKKLPQNINNINEIMTFEKGDLLFYFPEGFVDKQGKKWLLVYHNKRKANKYIVGRIKKNGNPDVLEMDRSDIEVDSSKRIHPPQNKGTEYISTP
jgi:low temperature requirement protein LtrA